MTVYDYEVNTIQGRQETLARYKGKVLLIVNTATKCGLAPQFHGLQKLHEKYADKGLAIVGFPSNQFMHQEPGDNEEVASACELNFGVTFPLYAKIDVNGKTAHPLYRFLKKESPGLLGSGSIKWNFTKFLVDREGRVVKRFAPTVAPEKLESAIEDLL
ncbi:glutathione peroxidase [Cohnella fermenti]|uniref:Glutathione peroxidase n=1 Tax=Cohnella fermenti TaxID=2565925 RepID=A0A4S4BNI1_9BACL|nr:glutathione peroxidase [Cohnella fermenti]THF75849.1 glutathione peroxidase [Cohnella fermenti]